MDFVAKTTSFLLRETTALFERENAREKHTRVAI